jgi:hypothetical protein
MRALQLKRRVSSVKPKSSHSCALSCSPLRMMEQHMSTTAMTTGTCSDGPIPRLYSTPLQLVPACIKSLSPREHRAHQRAARLDQDGDNKIKLAEHRSRGDLATGEMDGDDDLARRGKQPDREGGDRIQLDEGSSLGGPRMTPLIR